MIVQVGGKVIDMNSLRVVIWKGRKGDRDSLTGRQGRDGGHERRGSGR